MGGRYSSENPGCPAPTGVCAVDARSLTKTFPRPTSFFSGRGRQSRDKILAVDDVSLVIGEGEVFGLVGPNGAGKTTLIKMLTTLLVPTSGTASVGGFDVIRSDRKVRQVVGLVTSNERSFYWRLTGRQNLLFFADLYHVPRREAIRWIDELLEFVSMEDKGDERFDGYSTGMKQRLALARGLLSKPKILFMDEPTKGVDPIGAAEIIELIRGRIVELWNPTILITSHNLTEIERLCGRIALMHRARIIATGALAELRSMVRATDLYRMTIGNLQPEQLDQIAETAQALTHVQADSAADTPHRNGTIELEVSFEPESDGFSHLIRGVIEAGGDVVTCTAVEETIDDVFRKLVSDSAPEAERGK